MIGDQHGTECDYQEEVGEVNQSMKHYLKQICNYYDKDPDNLLKTADSEGTATFDDAPMPLYNRLGKWFWEIG